MFGTSSGTIIAIWLALEHPGAIRGAVLHEPPLIGVLPDPDRLQAQLMPAIEPAMTSGGPRAAMEAFVRFVSGDAAVDALDLKLRERALANAATFFDIEFGVLETVVPDEKALASVRVPLVPTVSPGSPPHHHERPPGWPSAWASRSASFPRGIRLTWTGQRSLPKHCARTFVRFSAKDRPG